MGNILENLCEVEYGHYFLKYKWPENAYRAIRRMKYTYKSSLDHKLFKCDKCGQWHVTSTEK